MGIFDTVKKTTIASRRREEILYGVALEEVENDEIRKGLYAKALSKADGDKEKADGIYLKLRVQSIMDDIESEQIDRREDARAYKAIQELNLIKQIEDQPTLRAAKSKVANTDYGVKRSMSQGVYTVSHKQRTKPSKAFSAPSYSMDVFQTKDLVELHTWLDKNIKQYN